MRAVAALLAIFLRKQFDMTCFSAAVRCGGAAVIATGARLPRYGRDFRDWRDGPGPGGGTAALGEAGVVLAEALFYVAALRGHRRWALLTSIPANAVAFAAGLLLGPGRGI